MSEAEHVSATDKETYGPAIAAILARARYLDAECILLLRKYAQAKADLEAAQPVTPDESNEFLRTAPDQAMHDWGVYAQQRDEAATCLARALRAGGLGPSGATADQYAEWTDALISAGPWHAAFLKPGEHFTAVS